MVSMCHSGSSRESRTNQPSTVTTSTSSRAVLSHCAAARRLPPRRGVQHTRTSPMPPPGGRRLIATNHADLKHHCMKSGETASRGNRHRKVIRICSRVRLWASGRTISTVVPSRNHQASHYPLENGGIADGTKHRRSSNNVYITTEAVTSTITATSPSTSTWTTKQRAQKGCRGPLRVVQ